MLSNKIAATDAKAAVMDEKLRDLDVKLDLILSALGGSAQQAQGLSQQQPS